MIVDTSAIVAILRRENGFEGLIKALDQSKLTYIATPTYLELCMVMQGSTGDQGKSDADKLLQTFDVQQLAFSPAMAKVAVEGFLRFGKGRMRGGLNFGDCISYAVSKVEMMPLLFKGDDFRKTDVECAV